MPLTRTWPCWALCSSTRTGCLPHGADGDCEALRVLLYAREELTTTGTGQTSVIYSTACDITAAANEIVAEGDPPDTDDLATIVPYITHTVRRFGDWTINLAPPEQTPATRLDLEPRVLFGAGPS